MSAAYCVGIDYNNGSHLCWTHGEDSPGRAGTQMDDVEAYDYLRCSEGENAYNLHLCHHLGL